MGNAGSDVRRGSTSFRTGGAHIKHLDLESGEVWVMGKGSKSAACRLVATLWRGLSTGLIWRPVW